MAYKINKTNGDLFAVVSNGTMNTDTSLYIIGKNYAGYGEFLGENFIRLLENAADEISPDNPLTGQLWFDTTNKSIKVFDGENFKNLGSANANKNEPSNSTIGDLWFDPINEQLFVFNGLEYILIGPSFTSGTGVSGAIVDVIYDITTAPHTVIKLLIDNDLIGIINKDPEFAPLVPIDGFDMIKPGIQLATDKEYLFEGTARRALNLVDGSGAIVEKLNRNSNDTMTGYLTIQRPIDSYHAATKEYVDGEITSNVPDLSDRVAVDGSNMPMTGNLTVSGSPSPRVIVKADSAGGWPGYDMQDETGKSKGILYYASTTDDITLRRYAIDGQNIATEMTLTDNGNVSVNGFAPTDYNHLTRKDYVDNLVSGAQGSIPAGITMLFAEKIAPTGWSQVTDQNDKMIRVVPNNTSGGTSGNDNGDSPIINDKTVASHSHGASSVNKNIDHTHSFSDTSSIQSANHTHNSGTLSAVSTPNHRHTSPSAPGLGQGASGPNTVQQSAGSEWTSYAGTHGHTMTGSTGTVSANHTHYVSGTTSSNGGTHNHTITVQNATSVAWEPKYYDVIFAKKN